MTAFNLKQHPIRLTGAGKHDLRSQFGVVPYRVTDEGKTEILVITARDNDRWILPKGWPMDGSTPAEAAATEAFEEAGVEGQVAPMVLGLYSYRKAVNGDDLPIVVTMFALRVDKVLKDWPEKRHRKRKWLSRKKAAALMKEPELAEIVRAFDPGALKH
ncbi:NUDIX hydrolase [Maritimibacter fusiformis]|uniref:NUDIX hydrolase n=1 Tax=Maritimibacter fusiformis TaxID=2603819 RepID=UPI001FE479E2|nr:NUDIX hydrolase [Maritimibacter fusiformis]